MNENSLYNPKLHLGFLPVRVLSANITQSLQSIMPKLFEEWINEINHNKLNPGIRYNIDQVPINNVAFLDVNKTIHLYENYNAYLWCISYSLLVLYNETLALPQNEDNVKIDYDSKPISEAIKLFEYAMSLRTNYSYWDYKLPNPETSNSSASSYVTKTNGIYISAMTFIICHEIGHSYYYHTTYHPSDSKQAKSEELLADDYAIDHFKIVSANVFFPTLKIGAVIGLCSLLFLDKEFNGGDDHPNKDERIKNLIERLNLKDDDYCWGIASLAIGLWARYNNFDIDLPQSIETYKETFYQMLNDINDQSNT